MDIYALLGYTQPLRDEEHVLMETRSNAAAERLRFVGTRHQEGRLESHSESGRASVLIRA